MDEKNSPAFRLAAWQMLWKGRWFWRFLAASLLLSLAGLAANEALMSAYEKLQIAHWGEYLGAYMSARLGHDLLQVPTAETALRMSVATGVSVLFGWVFTGCANCGEGLVLLKAARGGEEKWMEGLWRGFRAPFTHFALQFLVNLAVALPVLAVAGLVFAGLAHAGRAGDIPSLSFLCALLQILTLLVRPYFEPLWFVRAEHPEWSLAQGLAAARRRVRGHRRELVGLILSYRALPLCALLALAALVFPESRTFLAVPLALAALPVLLVVPWHMRAGVALFWSARCAAEAAETVDHDTEPISDKAKAATPLDRA